MKQVLTMVIALSLISVVFASTVFAVTDTTAQGTTTGNTAPGTTTAGTTAGSPPTQSANPGFFTRMWYFISGTKTTDQTPAAGTTGDDRANLPPSTQPGNPPGTTPAGTTPPGTNDNGGTTPPSPPTTGSRPVENGVVVPSSPKVTTCRVCDAVVCTINGKLSICSSTVLSECSAKYGSCEQPGCSNTCTSGIYICQQRKPTVDNAGTVSVNTVKCDGSYAECTAKYDACTCDGQQTLTGEPLPIGYLPKQPGNTTPPGVQPGNGCKYEDQTYASGTSFPSSDGCNTCSCTSTDRVVCTERMCLASGTSAGSPPSVVTN